MNINADVLREFCNRWDVPIVSAWETGIETANGIVVELGTEPVIDYEELMTIFGEQLGEYGDDIRLLNVMCN